MSLIELIYENGVFRPLHPIELPEGVQLEVAIIRQLNGHSAEVAHIIDADRLMTDEEHTELIASLDAIVALPYQAHPDGRTDISANHDDILYRKHGDMA